MITDLKEAGELIKDYFNNREEMKEALKEDRVQDVISEIADIEVDVYNSSLLEWVAENYNNIDDIEDAVKEMGIPEPFDFMKTIQMGQYHRNYMLLTEAVEEIRKEIKNNIKRGEK